MIKRKKGDTQNLTLTDNVYLPFKRQDCLIKEPAIASGILSLYGPLYS